MHRATVLVARFCDREALKKSFQDWVWYSEQRVRWKRIGKRLDVLVMRRAFRKWSQPQPEPDASYATATIIRSSAVQRIRHGVHQRMLRTLELVSEQEQLELEPVPEPEEVR